MEVILNILTLGIKPIYEKHYSFFLIIDEFRNKLPRNQNEARKLNEKDFAENSILQKMSQIITIVDLSTQKISLSESDIDVFYNKLNNFNYNFIIFKSYYKSIVNNLNRFNPKVTENNLDFTILKEILEETKENPLRPVPILIYHIKYKYKITSWLFN